MPHLDCAMIRACTHTVLWLRVEQKMTLLCVCVFTKRNWTKTAHCTRQPCANTHKPLCGHGFSSGPKGLSSWWPVSIPWWSPALPGMSTRGGTRWCGHRSWPAPARWSRPLSETWSGLLVQTAHRERQLLWTCATLLSMDPTAAAQHHTLQRYHHLDLFTFLLSIVFGKNVQRLLLYCIYVVVGKSK